MRKQSNTSCIDSTDLVPGWNWQFWIPRKTWGMFRIISYRHFLEVVFDYWIFLVVAVLLARRC